MPILQYLDVILGLAVVMLILATAVAAASQTILTSALVRARYLADGLGGLLNRSLGEELGASKLVDLLSDPRVGQKSALFRIVKFFNPRFSNLPLSPPEDLRREEFVLLLLEKLGAPPAVDVGFEPAAVLDSIREQTLLLEKQFPGLPAHEWRAKAILKVATETLPGIGDDARNKFATMIGAIFSGFDNTMDRVNDHTAHISTDETARKLLVEMAQRGDLDATLRQEAQKALQNGRLDLQNNQSSFAQSLMLPGVWISWILVSLGAPFWQGMIGKISGFRSLISEKEEKARAVRESRQAAV